LRFEEPERWRGCARGPALQASTSGRYQLKHLIVDEFSLVNGEVLGVLDAVARFYPRTRILLVGDRNSALRGTRGRARSTNNSSKLLDHPTTIALAGDNHVHAVHHRASASGSTPALGCQGAAGRLPLRRHHHPRRRSPTRVAFK
jgi:hypothetical protein